MIFPIPVQIQCFNEVYVLKECYEMKSVYEFYRSADKKNRDLTYELSDVYEEEEYNISVNTEGIRITYAKEVGKFRALTSLYQLMAEGPLKFCEIYDKPQFSRRGYMLDISRGKIPTRETLFGYVDMLTGLKYNEFQLYMENPCYKYDKHKELIDYDCLTQEDIVALNEYCKERFIDLVPNQNSFGHLKEWLKIPKFNGLSLSDGTKITSCLNPLDERSLEFMDSLYESLLPHFDSDYVNVGFDEVGALGKYQTKEACEKYGADTVFYEYLNKVSDLVKEKYNKTIMFWADMIIKYPNSYNKIPKNAIALEWAYDPIQNQLLNEKCRKLKEADVPFYVCPAVNAHQSFTGRADVTTFNLRTAGEVGRQYGAKGYLLTEWYSPASPQFAYTAFVPCALGAQYAWNVGEEQDGETFKTEFIYAAEEYADRYIFHAKLSKLVYRLANYYLLEPERIHNGSICGTTFFYPMHMEPTKFIDLSKYDGMFYYKNVENYVKAVMEDIRRSNADDITKREILLNGKMVLFANMLNMVRETGKISKDDFANAKNDAEEMEKEYIYLRRLKNFAIGEELYIEPLHERVNELEEFVEM